MFGLLAAGRLPQTSFTQLDATHCVFEVEAVAQINHLCVFMDGSAPFPPGYAGTIHLLLPGGGGGGSSESVSDSRQEQWRLLGCLKNERPSAVYRLKGLGQNSSLYGGSGGSTSTSRDDGQAQEGGSSNLFTATGLTANAAMFETTTAQGSVTAMLGISIEPEHIVDEQMRILRSTSTSTSTATGAGDQGMELADETQQTGVGIGPGALVRSGGVIDPYMALSLAPKIAQNIFSYLSSFAPDSAPQTVPLLQKWLDQFERKLKIQGTAWLEKQGGEGG